MSHDIGDTSRLRLVDVLDEDGKAADPGELKLEIRRPDGEVIVREWPSGSEIVKESTGNFNSLVLWDEAGAWEYRWLASEGVTVKEGGTVYVGIETMDTPFPDEDFTVAEVWARSPLLQTRYVRGSGDPELVLRVATAAPLVGSLTGRIIAGTEGEAVSDGMKELALSAIAMKTEQLDSAVGSVSSREEALERSALRSISAGSWSESYWGPGEAAQGKQLDTDPTLASLLWALCTEQKKGEWLELWEGKEKGFSVVEAFAYSQRPGGY
jgi:hypothetical protein